MKTILCYGDSNTYGAVAGGGRYGRYERWPGYLQKLLGYEEYYIIEEGCNGRTTLWDDPIEENKNGKTYLLPCMQSHKPLDLIVLMLGTNDLKNRFSLTATDIAWSLENLINTIQSSTCGPADSAPTILLISPPEVTTLSTAIAGVLVGAREKREELAPLLAALAENRRIAFIDAAPIAHIDPGDGLHLDLQGHKALAEAVAAKIRQILG